MTEGQWAATSLALAEDAADIETESWDSINAPRRPAAGEGRTMRAAWANVRLWPKDAPEAARSVFTRIVAYVVPR
jgi:hypothetical protein